MEYYVGVEEEAVTTIRLLHRCWDSFGGGSKEQKQYRSRNHVESRFALIARDEEDVDSTARMAVEDVGVGTCYGDALQTSTYLEEGRGIR